MYYIEELPFGHKSLFRMGNQQGDSVQILPFAGANLHELTLDNTRVVEGAADLEDFISSAGTFAGAHLCPFPSRISQGTYSVNGSSYKLDFNDPIGDNAIHGLVFDKNFSMVDSRIHTDSAWISLGHEFESVPGYPFNFYIEVKYKLERKSLTLETKIRNKSKAAIPMADGWHPYYHLGDQIDDLNIEIPSSRKMDLDSNMIPNGKISSYRPESNSLKGVSLDDCFILNPIDGIQKTVLKSKDKTLEIWQETGEEAYNYLVIYTPGSRDSIAIEPMTCAPDAFNNQEGLIMLSEGQELVLKTGVKLK